MLNFKLTPENQFKGNTVSELIDDILHCFYTTSSEEPIILLGDNTLKLLGEEISEYIDCSDIEGPIRWRGIDVIVDYTTPSNGIYVTSRNEWNLNEMLKKYYL